MRAAKKLKYGAERLGQERGWGERQNKRDMESLSSLRFIEKWRKSTRALPATLPEAVQNSRLPKEPFGTMGLLTKYRFTIIYGIIYLGDEV